MSLVLVVEDDDKIAAPLVRTLEREGHTVERFAEGRPAVQRLGGPDGAVVDLLLLDLGLPDMDGLDVCRHVREAGYVGGIIILTARDGELDRVVGLDQGADDYLAKPFALAELLARTRALLRRSPYRPDTTPTTPQDGDPSAASTPDPRPPSVATARTGLRVDGDARRVWVGDSEITPTSKEFDVLAMLDVRRGAVVSREDLISEVWDENWFGSTKTLDTTVGRLRQKLEEARAPARITTVRGVGFRLEDAPGA
ncbi:response regulator transcription factor [Serinicoccus sp. LYQ131]|uniref:response regulator transcription factor n=1 Tax=Serinicoccus sp. LYQ131 TaxID=3378797 RepID=UPI0038545106